MKFRNGQSIHSFPQVNLDLEEIWNLQFCIKYHEQYDQSDGCVLLTEVVQDGSPRKLDLAEIQDL